MPSGKARRHSRASVVRAFRHSPELANYQKGTYQGATIANFCTDLNRKLAFAKEHEPALAAVGAGQGFQAKLEAKLRALESDSGAQEAAIASLPDNNRAFCEVRSRTLPLPHQRRHRPIVVRLSPIPKRHVRLNTDVRSVLFRPLARARHRIFARLAPGYGETFHVHPAP